MTPARARERSTASPQVLVAVAGAAALVLGVVGGASAVINAPATSVGSAAAAGLLVDDAAHPAAPSKSHPAAAPSAPSAPAATAKPAPAKVVNASAPVPATPETKAQNVPADPPAGSGTGRRIVYSKALMTLWIVASDGHTVRRYPVVGRWDRPAKGTYHVYSMSTDSMNEHSKVTFKYMVRFAWGPRTEASIGFHTIPVYYEAHDGNAAGTRMHGIDQLGLPIAAGGCVRQADADARFLYHWVHVGDTVVVLPSP
jgi:lipoprotein-anchoring transpeptidase ErfK/SrfK